MQHQLDDSRPGVLRATSHALVCFDHRIHWKFKRFRNTARDGIGELRLPSLELRQRSHRHGQKCGELRLSQTTQSPQITKETLVRRDLNELVHRHLKQVSRLFERVNLRRGCSPLPHSDSTGRDTDKPGQFSTRHIAGHTMGGDLVGSKATEDASAHPRHPYMTDHFASPSPVPSQVALVDYCYRLTPGSFANWEEPTSMHSRTAAGRTPGRHPAFDVPSVQLGHNMTQGGAAVLSPP